MTLRRNRTAARSDNGAAAVEFAIVAVLLLLLIMGIIDFGRLLFVQQSVKSASREGARVAVVQNTNLQVFDAATSAASSAVSLSGSNGTPATIKLEKCNAPTSVCSSWATVFETSDSSTIVGPGNIVCSDKDTVTTVRVTVRVTFRWLTPVGALPGYVNPNLQGTRTLSGNTVMRCEY